jgi:hypothetical protein
MIAVLEYRRRAVEVDGLAEDAISGVQRAAILEIAAQWRKLADDREQFLKLRPILS